MSEKPQNEKKKPTIRVLQQALAGARRVSRAQPRTSADQSAQLRAQSRAEQRDLASLSDSLDLQDASTRAAGMALRIRLARRIGG